MILNKEVSDNSQEFLLHMYNFMNNLEACALDSLEPSKTVLVIVDLINGFVREGSLKSDRNESIIPNIVELCEYMKKRNIPIVAFIDCHSEDSQEFNYYPPHCTEGSSESSLVDELKVFEDAIQIKKSSTNGFLEKKFSEFLENNKNIENFVVVGDCTDICVLQFTLTLKCYFNTVGKFSNIIVPANCVETYDSPIHNGDLMNLFAMYNMHSNGIKIVKEMC